MQPVDISSWDAESMRRLEAALTLANAYWLQAGVNASLQLDAAAVGRLVFSHAGRGLPIRLVWGGGLLALAGLSQARAALMFRGYLRLPRMRAVDPTVSPEASNGLMIRGNGKRRPVDALCGFLVHEMMHAQQELRSRLGALGFGLGYLATLGIPAEREADAEEERAIAFARGVARRQA